MSQFKPVLQSHIKDCGVACIQAIIIYYGGYISLEKLREDTFTNNFGTNIYNMVECLKKWNFDAIGVLEHDLTKQNINFPLIAHMKLENGLEHFVVVKSIDKSTVALMDPAIGNTRMKISKFNRLFTGHIILIYPKDSIIKMEKEMTLKKLFLRIIKEEKALILKIIIVSFLITFLSILISYYLRVGSNIFIDDYKYLLIIFLILLVFKIFINYIRNYYQIYLSNKIDLYIIPEFIRHIFSLPQKSISNRTPEEIMMRIDDISNIKNLFTDIFISSFLDSILMLTSIFVLFFISKYLSYIVLTLIVLYIVIGIISSKLLYNKVLENINYHTDTNNIILESVENITSIKHLNIKDKILKAIEKKLSKYLLNNYNFSNYFNKIDLIKNLVLEFGLFIINSYGLYLCFQQTINIVDLFTFDIILNYLVDPLKNIIDLLPRYIHIKASFSKVTEFINIEEESKKDSNYSISGSIEFRNVGYSYNNYFKTLNNISFKIDKGSNNLLIGPSGCGKSTICKLINKDLVTTNGEVILDDININDISLKEIRKDVLYISQNERLFSGTIKENITFERNISDQDFDKVCKLTKVSDIVSKKGLRYDTFIEASNNNLSGGEIQRIILARGLLKNSKIIILDEALSEVNLELEKEIINNIKNSYQDKTIIYISHKTEIDCFENIINLEVLNGVS